MSDRRVLPWTVGEEREIARTRIFSLHGRRCTSALRPDVSFEAAILKCPDWVNVIALTPGQEVVLIEQYRHGIDRVTLEIPGGMVDEGEGPVEAAVRELLEETGHAGGEPRILGVTTPNPAFQDNRLTTVLVPDCRLVAEPEGDAHEEIAVRLTPLADIPRLLREGEIHHALVVAAFALLQLSRPA